MTTIIDSVISDNQNSGFGGGICSYGALVVDGSIISGNSATTAGASTPAVLPLPYDEVKSRITRHERMVADCQRCLIRSTLRQRRYLATLPVLMESAAA